MPRGVRELSTRLSRTLVWGGATAAFTGAALLGARPRWSCGWQDFTGSAIGAGILGLGVVVLGRFISTRRSASASKFWTPWMLVIAAVLVLPHHLPLPEQACETRPLAERLAVACGGRTAVDRLLPLPHGLSYAVPDAESKRVLAASVRSRVRSLLVLRFVRRRGKAVGFVVVVPTPDTTRALGVLDDNARTALHATTVKMRLGGRVWILLNDGETREYFGQVGCHVIVIQIDEDAVARKVATVLSRGID